MGGLRTSLPITFLTMFIATLAHRRDSSVLRLLLARTRSSKPPTVRALWLWILGVVTAGLTSFYMFRLIFMTFFGESRVDQIKSITSTNRRRNDDSTDRAGDSGDGWRVGGLPAHLLWGNAFVRFLAPVVGTFTAHLRQGIYLVAGHVCRFRIAGLGLRTSSTSRARNSVPARWRMKPAYDLLLNKYYIDEMYNLSSRPTVLDVGQCAESRDRRLMIDGTAEGTGLAGADSGAGGASC